MSFEKWEPKQWGDLATLEYGKSLRDYSDSLGKVPVFGTNGPIGFTDVPLCSQPGVVIGRKGAYRGVHFSAEPFFVIDTAFYLKPKTSQLDIKFAYYQLLTQDINGLDSGSAIPSTSREDFYGLELMLPPLATQRRIAALLTALDDKIELNRRMNETLEGLAQAVWGEWFGGYLVGEGLPEGWRWGVLEDVIGELETGGRPKGGVKEILEGIPSIGAESVTRIGEFDFSKTRYVPQAFFQSMKKGIIQHKDILIYKDGGKPGNFIPHISMVGHGFPFEVCAINEHVYRLQANESAMQNYLYLALNSEPCMEEMKIKGTGVAIPGLNSTALKSLALLIPDKSSLEKFDGIIEPMFSQILKNSNQSRTLTALRDALLPRLMSGEINV